MISLLNFLDCKLVDSQELIKWEELHLCPQLSWMMKNGFLWIFQGFGMEDLHVFSCFITCIFFSPWSGRVIAWLQVEKKTTYISKIMHHFVVDSLIYWASEIWSLTANLMPQRWITIFFVFKEILFFLSLNCWSC